MAVRFNKVVLRSPLNCASCSARPNKPQNRVSGLALTCQSPFIFVTTLVLGDKHRLMLKHDYCTECSFALRARAGLIISRDGQRLLSRIHGGTIIASGVETRDMNAPAHCRPG